MFANDQKKGCDTLWCMRSGAQIAEAYWKCLKKYSCACFTLLSSYVVIGEFENYPIVQKKWNRLKIAYGGTSMTMLHAMALKFKIYLTDPKDIMAQQLRVIIYDS